MSNPPKVPTDWKMWDEIEGSLEKKNKNRFLPILMGLPFLMLLSGLIGYLLAPTPNPLITNSVESQKDTIYISKTINTRDTLFKTEYITQWKYRSLSQNLQWQKQAENLASLNQNLQKKLDVIDSKLSDYRIAFSESVIKDNPQYSHLDYFKSGSINVPNENSISKTDRLPIAGLAFSPILTPRMLNTEARKIMILNDLWLERLLKNSKSESFINQMIPDYVNLGISAEIPGMAFTDNLSPGLESGIGLNVELLFSPKFSLITGIRNRSTQNKTSDELISSMYPQPTITPEETFKNLKVKSSFIDIPFSFKYKVLKHFQNDIYLTGGLLMSKLNSTEYVYEYIRNTSEIYYEEKSQGGNWNLGSSIIGVGYELDAWNNTAAFFETYARYNFKSDADAIHGIGFRFGLNYKI